MNLAQTEITIIASGFIAFMIGCLLGVFGMMGMYEIFPDVIEEPPCECIKAHESYDQLRNTFSIIGWVFALIPILIWQIKVRRDIKNE